MDYLGRREVRASATASDASPRRATDPGSGTRDDETVAFGVAVAEVDPKYTNRPVKKSVVTNNQSLMLPDAESTPPTNPPSTRVPPAKENALPPLPDVSKFVVTLNPAAVELEYVKDVSRFAKENVPVKDVDPLVAAKFQEPLMIAALHSVATADRKQSAASRVRGVFMFVIAPMKTSFRWFPAECR